MMQSQPTLSSIPADFQALEIQYWARKPYEPRQFEARGVQWLEIRALAAMYQKQWQAAEHLYQEIVDIADPVTAIHARLAIVKILEKSGQTKRAEYYKVWISKRFHLKEAYLALSLILMERKAWLDVVSLCDSAIAVFQQNGDVQAVPEFWERRTAALHSLASSRQVHAYSHTVIRRPFDAHSGVQ